MFRKGGGGVYYDTKIIKVFPNTPQYFVQMILNNLQKTKKTNPKIQKQSKDLEKNINTCTKIGKA